MLVEDGFAGFLAFEVLLTHTMATTMLKCFLKNMNLEGSGLTNSNQATEKHHWNQKPFSEIVDSVLLNTKSTSRY